MATSVEARVPFLDHEFVELVMSISQSQKIPGLRTKHLLKQAVQGLIPDNIIHREKQVFRLCSQPSEVYPVLWGATL